MCPSGYLAVRAGRQPVRDHPGKRRVHEAACRFPRGDRGGQTGNPNAPDRLLFWQWQDERTGWCAGRTVPGTDRKPLLFKGSSVSGSAGHVRESICMDETAGGRGDWCKDHSKALHKAPCHRRHCGRWDHDPFSVPGF